MRRQLMFFFPGFNDIKNTANEITDSIYTQFSIQNFKRGIRNTYQIISNIRDSHIFRICENGLTNAFGCNKLINLISHNTHESIKTGKYVLNSIVFIISSCGSYKVHLTHTELCQQAESLLLKAEDIFFRADAAFIREDQLLKEAGYLDFSMTIKGDGLFPRFDHNEFLKNNPDELISINENACFDAVLKTLSICDILAIIMPNSLLIMHMPLTALAFIGIYIASYQKYETEFNQARYLKCLHHKIILTQEKILSLQTQFGFLENVINVAPDLKEDRSASIVYYPPSYQKEIQRLQKIFLIFFPYLNTLASGASMTAGVKKVLETLHLQNPLLKFISLISTFIGVTLQTYKGIKSDEDFRALLTQFSSLLSNLENSLDQANNVLSDEQAYVLRIDQLEDENSTCAYTSTPPSKHLNEDDLLKLIETSMQDKDLDTNVLDTQIAIPTCEEHDTMRFFSRKKLSPRHVSEMAQFKKYQ